jgi:DNA processing protein
MTLHCASLMTNTIENLSESEQEWLARHNGALVRMEDPEYPASLKTIADPPPVLAVWGDLEAIRGDLLSIVGSREPARESVDWMEAYVPELIKLGVVVVSGGARGIDQRAHSLALRNKSRTVVVLPSGFQKLYPRDLEYWKDMILDRGGCFVSELSPSMPMKSHYFHQRNRIVVGLSRTLLLVEAKRRSGSSMTARLALENGRTLCVVPGSPTRANWGGGLDMLNDGAFLARDAVDVWLLHSASGLRALDPPRGR